MFEPQRFVDLQENSSFGDPKSWLSGDNHNIMNGGNSSRAQSSLTYSNANLDRVLYNDLVEMIPLVQSLIEQKANNSFTRRGSMIYTKTPSRESLSRKVSDIKGRMRKKKDQADKSGNNNQDGDNYSIVSSEALATEKVNEELISLREQLEDLQRKLFEKDELLKSAEISKNEINDVHTELDRLKRHAVEKDSLIKSIQLQLSDAKIKLADKQAALEKARWEAMTSKQQVEKLQNNIDSMRGEFSTFMTFINGLTKNNPTTDADDYELEPYHLDPLPYIDDLDDKEMLKMEEAKQAYLVALAATKEKQDEESMTAAASARLCLQSFLFRSEK
ncbi:suppressor protein SRP40-like [Hibiscus syriacus]|uniref:Suppressor protein SRP40-like n=1 Tax=Hibiscus syriacus TaxID=106335 RepID=A0A6A2Z445_HIBSY|nr:protein MICROTUBULE BINDING PROTEIN 2C-like [Hibiscus syriacus]XP_039020211.1 protein MICROTUBULE BINDING PROTEIN 2C-like [Hibiscus syriacus]KAE8686199.1 suppressor protein SRP40-like [Hibiscus syriacus]